MARSTPSTGFQILAEVQSALDAGSPVVALESTVITHGLPRPTNLELARRMEAIVREVGAVPATVAVLRGQLQVGLSDIDLQELAQYPEPMKVSRRDLGVALARAVPGGTTVAATMLAAHKAGIRVFATGGIGGVHRGDSGDVSADLSELGRTPVAVVCAGAKSILDLPRTLEWLETAGVPTIGWATDHFPAFLTRDSGLPLSVRAESATDIASILSAGWDLGLENGAVVAVPIPEKDSLPPALLEHAIDASYEAAKRAGIRSRQLTPYLLEELSRRTDGKSLAANLALLEHNARRAAELATALCGADR